MALIPAERLYAWEPAVNVGIPGGIDQYRPGGINEFTDFINVTQAPYNADNTGVTDARAAIQSAIGVGRVYLPTGTYRLEGALSIPINYDGMCVRGDGPGLTILKPTGNGIEWGPSDGWTFPNPPAEVTAGLAQGSTSITLDDATDFTVGQIIKIAFGDQNVDADIEAGAVPVVGVGGWDPAQPLRRQVTEIVGKVGNVLTIFPPIYADVDPALGALVWYAFHKVSVTGIEDLTIDMEDSGSAVSIGIYHGLACWVYNVEITNMLNYGISIADSLMIEVRKCNIHDRQSGGSNGSAILVNTSSALLVEDNILRDVQPLWESNAGMSGSVFGYNLCENAPILGSIAFSIDTNHGPHNSHNLYEGNITPSIISDGYFGGESELTVYRNWIHGTCFDESATTFCLSLKRFTRTASMVGNVVGRTGVSQGAFDYGFPNIGNGDSSGTAEPSTGDFWKDWKATGTLTTRTSDTVGVVTLNSPATAFNGQFISIGWSGSSGVTANVTSSTSGNTVIGFEVIAGAVLPALSTAVTVGMQPGGFQERDLDVENTVIDKGNYLYAAAGAPGSMSSLGGDTLVDSFYRQAKPIFFASLDWPPFDPESPNVASYESIPAGYRWINGDDPPSQSGATISVANVTNFNIL